MQKSESLIDKPLSAISSVEKPRVDKTGKPSSSSFDIESICQRHIELTMAQLPQVAGWIVYRNWDSQTRQSVEDCRQNKPGFDSSVLSYLESEAWLQEELPVRTLTQLTLRLQYRSQKRVRGKVARRTIGQKHSAHACVYVYLFGQEEKTDEYWLLWTDEVLSPDQQQNVQQQAQLLQERLTLALQYHRQQKEIQLLEQVIRRGEHQLRNSLGLIGLYAENLCLGLPTGLFQEQAIVIRETANELSGSLTKLLACTQQAKLHRASHNLKEILAEVLKVLQPKLDKKHLQICYPSDSANLAVDRWQMKQVFENLLSNAIDFSPLGGIVTCNWRVFRNEVLVEISDQGPGLSQEDLINAFTPFYSRRPGGTGLGLTIAQKMILDHQGSIWVQNLQTGGAQFSFTLPCPVLC